MDQTLNHEHDISLVSNAFGFLRLPLCFSPYTAEADVVITGVPFDMATSGRPGTRFGPNGMRQVSTQLAWEEKRYPCNFKLSDRLNVIDCGVAVLNMHAPYEATSKADIYETYRGYISFLKNM